MYYSIPEQYDQKTWMYLIGKLMGDEVIVRQSLAKAKITPEQAKINSQNWVRDNELVLKVLIEKVIDLYGADKVGEKFFDYLVEKKITNILYVSQHPEEYDPETLKYLIGKLMGDKVIVRQSLAHLGFQSNESPNSDQITKLYRKLALTWHPDKWKNSSIVAQKAAEEKFKIISDAKDQLQNYDDVGVEEGVINRIASAAADQAKAIRSADEVKKNKEDIESKRRS